MSDLATIAAIATPPGTGGVGIVRLSGPGSLTILKALCPRLTPTPRSHRLYLTDACWPGEPSQVLDQIMAVFMRAPRSYTAEDVVELHGHGGVVNMRRLLEAACLAGAVPAAPGEFTQRAFLNGRLDLTQAEAVADIIHASSLASLRLAQRHLQGDLGHRIGLLQERLVVALTLTEAAIDFSTEEHVYQLDSEALLERIGQTTAELRRLLGTFDAGRQLREGIRVVILGRPNAGKSTLFNLLCGQPRAIVTDTPGTTRDWLEEAVVVEDVFLRLIDTAGLRQTTDDVEAIGVHRSIEQARSADLILWLLDGSDPAPLSSEDLSPLEHCDADVLPILNKQDLPQRLTPEQLQQIQAIAGRPPIKATLINQDGALPPAQPQLLASLAQAARRRLQPALEGATITRQRHRAALDRALEALDRARQAALDEMSHEFIALDLRLGLEATGEVVGEVTTDMILGRIFSEFCVGK